MNLWHFAGVGAALVTIATFSIVGKYFPGKQLVPVAANVLFYNIGLMIFPLIIGKLEADSGLMK